MADIKTKQNLFLSKPRRQRGSINLLAQMPAGTFSSLMIFKKPTMPDSSRSPGRCCSRGQAQQQERPLIRSKVIHSIPELELN